MHQLSDKHFVLPSAKLVELTTAVRQRTLALVNDLEEEQFNVPVMDLVNPFRWELGHIAFFYEAFLLTPLDHIAPVIPGGNDLYNSFEVDHNDRWGLDLPSRQGTFEYMETILEQVVSRLEGDEPSPQETYLYLVAVLHEAMHDEAIHYMRQTLGYAKPQMTFHQVEASGNHSGDVAIPGGIFQLGAQPEDPFVYDNEKWAQPVEVQPFSIARAPVTNAEYQAFVEDRGYHRRELWSTQGWIWKTKRGAWHPIYWSRGQSGWLRKDFDCWVTLEPHAPVSHISWYEAEAYCHWANRRLPTEVEWTVAATAEPNSNGTALTDHKRKYPWGDEINTGHHANLDSQAMGCVDVGAFPEGDSAFGCRQMLGNVWEWTSTPFYPFPGFVVDYPYVEYSAPWFGYPKVLKGGAWATDSQLANNTYRNFFQPGRNDVFAGFRTCAK